ncbi:MAG: DNA repair protein RecN [Candidatus Marinimicrobia bacterium]|nr:DNA repair protein RecN [Candidatus Neomarinimicrobiota bacterium]
MLSNLFIKNFAIIDELNIDFKSGLNLVTGETGAGKSIIVNAVKLLLGGKFSKELFRTGEDRTTIEGLFKNGDKDLFVRRVFLSNGTSRTFLNDEPSSLEKVKNITKFMVDLHGQHEQQRLLDPAQHIDYLDSWGSYQQELIELCQLYSTMETIIKKIRTLKAKEKKTYEKKELYEFQLQEISSFNLSIEDELKLQDTFKVITNANTLQEAMTTILQLADENDHSIHDSLSQIEKILNRSIKIDSNLESYSTRIDQLIIEIEDIVSELTQYVNSLSSNEQLMEDINQKISYVEMLKRKYGGSFEKVIEHREFLREWLQEKDNYTNEIKLLEEKLVITRHQYLEAALFISQSRKTTAILFEGEIIRILSMMDMKNTIFTVNFIPLSENQFSALGIDSCQFFISTNIGEDVKPLSKVVSGGEISRIMLAIKIALQGKDKTSSLIFDEVDTGISGATAEKIGEMIYQLSSHQQIICITHLPQIASKGDYHLRVYKGDSKGTTSTKIQSLNFEERILEIAGLISGKTITDSGKQQAIKLLEESHG